VHTGFEEKRGHRYPGRIFPDQCLSQLFILSIRNEAILLVKEMVGVF